MKQKLTHSGLIALAMALAATVLGSYFQQAQAGQYDVTYAIRISGTGPLLMPYLGTSGSWQTVATTSTNGFLQTTGSGLTVNPSPIITGTANIASPAPGELGTSATGQLLIWTGSNWVH
jgi:hypothetical protein